MSFKKVNVFKTEEEERKAFLYGIIGNNGSGKTVLANKMARMWREANPDGFIIGFDPTNGFSEVLDYEISLEDIEDNSWYDVVLDKTNCLLILDELRVIHPEPKANKKLLKLMAMRRYQKIDIIYIVHNPSLVLELFTYFTSKYFIFYTIAKYGNFQKRIPNYHECASASYYINRYVRHFGEGKYPVFPYMVVDTRTQKITGVNLDTHCVMKLRTLT